MLNLSANIENLFERWVGDLNLTALEREILRYRVLTKNLEPEELDLCVKLVTKTQVNVHDVQARNGMVRT